MGKVSVFLGVRDRSFSEKLKGLSMDVEIVGESTCMEAIKENPKRADLLFLDRIPTMGFINLYPFTAESAENAEMRHNLDEITEKFIEFREFVWVV